MNLIRKLCTTSARHPHPRPSSRDPNLAKQARNLWPKWKKKTKKKLCSAQAAGEKPKTKRKRARSRRKMITALGIFLNLRNSFPKCVRQVWNEGQNSQDF